MGSRQVTIELPDDLYEQLVDASRLSGASLDATILDLVERGLRTNGGTIDDTVSDARRRELQRARAALAHLIEPSSPESEARASIFDPRIAAQLRAGRPVLDPPLSRTIIEDRADRI